MQVLSQHRKDPLEKEMVTHSSVLAWEILWTKESGGLQSMWSQRVGHNLSACTHTTHTHTHMKIEEYLPDEEQIINLF